MREEEDRFQSMPLLPVMLGVVAQKDRQGVVTDFLHKVSQGSLTSI
jgi:hypothetical protein